uniref:Uncharacterized protein n=1 Tax=Megaselia scalaris TaxID=36166 RepID=T1GFI4_MEGSC
MTTGDVIQCWQYTWGNWWGIWRRTKRSSPRITVREVCSNTLEGTDTCPTISGSNILNVRFIYIHSS